MGGNGDSTTGSPQLTPEQKAVLESLGDYDPFGGSVQPVVREPVTGVFVLFTPQYKRDGSFLDFAWQVIDTGIREEPPVLSPNVVAQIELQREQLEQQATQFAAGQAQEQTQFEAGQAQQAEQFGVTTDLTLQQLQQQADQIANQVRQFNQTHAIDLQALELQRDNLALATARGNRQDAIALTGLVADRQNAINQNRLTVAGMQQQAQALNAQLMASAQGRSADREFQAAQASADRAIQLTALTDQNLSRNIDQQIEIARQIADFTRDPGDIVANIAAIEQFGSISTALASGFTGLTEESLAPLESLIGTQESTEAEGERLEARRSSLAGALDRALSPTLGAQAEVPVQTPEFQAPQLQQTDLGGLFNQFVGALGGSLAGAVMDEEPTETGVLGPQATFQREFEAGNIPPEALEQFKLAGIVPSMEQGGFANESVEVHDNEIVTPVPGGGFVVTPMDEKPKQSAQEGGVFGTGGTTRARALLSDVFAQALQRLLTAAPAAGRAGGIISPVGVSAPGTNPELVEAAAGVAAAGRGVRQNVFRREAAEARPTALMQGVLRRTR